MTAAAGSDHAAHSGDADVDGTGIVHRRHADWIEHQVRWRWLLDSYEGGDRYRNAVYGPDRRGLPCRNLFRHKREYPDPQAFPNNFAGFGGSVVVGETSPSQVASGPWPGQVGADAATVAMDDDYELRRARTPIPEFVAEAVEIHLGKVYDQDVARRGPEDLLAWWRDVDGRGTPISDYMRETIAPLLLVLGCLDVCIDHPQAPDGEAIVTRADELRLGLDKVVASYILPQNMLWWRTDQAGRYLECLVREYADPSDRIDHDDRGNAIDATDTGKHADLWRREYVRYRYWNGHESILFSYDGATILGRTRHRYGRVPIVRLVDLKKHRTPNVGKSRYEAIAEYQREFYNRDSELILSDTLQAHPLLSGPDDYCQADNTMSVGPGYIIPMKKNAEKGTYQGWEYVSPPKDPADSLRRNKADLIDLKDRRAGLLKPAGSSGLGGTVTGQSGIAKQLDAQNGHKQLSSIGRSLARSERLLAEYALIVWRSREITHDEREEIDVVYPSRFELYSAEELTDSMTKLQQVIKNSGAMPLVEGMAIRSIVRQLLLGLSDREYRELDSEIDGVLAVKAGDHDALREMADPGIRDETAATQGEGSAEQAGGVDPTGQSAATLAANLSPVVI
jgi:hypothetical protein